MNYFNSESIDVANSNYTYQDFLIVKQCNYF